MDEQQGKDNVTIEREKATEVMIERDGILRELQKENKELYSYLQGKDREIKNLENAIVRLALRLKK